MAWTNPQTWVDGVLVTAATLNAHIRDQLRYLKGLDGVPSIENAIELPEQAAPATPAAGRGRMFVGNAAPRNGVAACVDDGGVVYQMVRYAEGTFVPTLIGATTAGTFTYNAALTTAQYAQIGNRIFINGRILVTATIVAPTGNLAIGGLPFVSGAHASNILGGVSVTYTGLNLVAGYTQVEGIVIGGGSTVALYEVGDNVARAFVQGGELAATCDWYFWGVYTV